MLSLGPRARSCSQNTRGRRPHPGLVKTLQIFVVANDLGFVRTGT